MQDTTDQLLAATRALHEVVETLSRRLSETTGRSISDALALRAIEAGARHLSELADHTSQHASSASRLVDRLVADGLVDRNVDPNDRRALHLQLTPAGADELARLRDQLAAFLDAVAAELGQQDARPVADALDRFVAAAERTLQATAPGPEAARPVGRVR